MELSTLPALKASCLPAFMTLGLDWISRSADAAAAAVPPGSAGLVATPLDGTDRSEWCADDALASVGASTAIAPTSAPTVIGTALAPGASLLPTRESPCEGLDRATGWECLVPGMAQLG